MNTPSIDIVRVRIETRECLFVSCRYRVSASAKVCLPVIIRRRDREDL